MILNATLHELFKVEHIAAREAATKAAWLKVLKNEFMSEGQEVITLYEKSGATSPYQAHR